MAHTIDLSFSAADGTTVKTGPFERFCLQGETLRREPGAPPIAVHEDHYWLVDGKKFSRFDCDCHVQIELMSVDGKRIGRHGPYKSFSSQDGVTFADRTLFAFADRAIGDWYCHADGQHWALIIVEATD